MEQEYRLADWHVEFTPDDAPPTIRDAQDRLVATVHAETDAETYARAILIAKAPSLAAAVRLAYQSFQVIAANDWGRASEASRQLLPYFETALAGIPDPPEANK